jgi:cystathionine beta-lyase
MQERLGTRALKWEASPWGQTSTARYPFWVADMDIPSPEGVQHAILERAKHPYYGYTLPPELKSLVCQWGQTRQNRSIAEADITYAGGLMPSLAAALRAFTQEGDGVVLQPPVYFPFYGIVKDNRRRVIENPLIERQGRWEMDFEHLEGLFKAGAKAMILCAPHNPVGRVWDEKELKTLNALVREYGIWLLSDEIHSDLVWAPFLSPLDVPGAPTDRILAFYGPNKTFNLAGLPLSFVQSPVAKNRKAYRQEQEAMGFHLPSIFAGEATYAAYSTGQGWLDQLLIQLKEREGELLQGLPKGFSVRPVEGTYLSWIKVDGEILKMGGFQNSNQLAQFLDQKFQLRLSPGTWFQTGGEGFLRWNFACGQGLLLQGLEALNRAAKSFNTP